ncbi:YncE family protein [Parahaliea mediterranea]|uniref:Beta-propeller fold lactonase family protein n=1 Tax=Parahaliea mediterranea TaxID=651086 RepID=A0A939DFJ7_9GAMM|nr:beta-propeller fold lactonase family protein [Parahaliea mediterranea]MBN7797188.1 beta-propeller fold lactonase family protein [Parahaliea mediterranea]
MKSPNPSHGNTSFTGAVKSRIAAGICSMLLPSMTFAAPVANYLLVESLESHDVQVVDTQARKVVKNIEVRDNTDDVMGSPDGERFYIALQGNDNSPFGHQTNESGKVLAFDTRTKEQLWSLSVDGSPHHLARSPDGKFIYVPMYNRNWILVVNADDGTIASWWPAILGNHSLEISRDGKHIYAGNMMTDAVYVYDTERGELVMAIDSKGQEGNRPIVIDDDRKLMYMQLSKLHGFEVRRLDTGEYVETIKLPPLENDPGKGGARDGDDLYVNKLPTAFPYTYNHGLAMTPDGKYLLAAATVANYVAVYSLPDFELRGTVGVGKQPNWIVSDPEGKFAYVSNPGDDSISVIDIEKIEEVAQIPVGTVPRRIAFSTE